jgi:alkylation response protein AidB-like acyl-CoA dehydrogenase
METLAAERESLSALSPVVTRLMDNAVGLWARLPAERRTAEARDRLTKLWCEAQTFRLLIEWRRGRGELPDGPIVKVLYGHFWQRLMDLCVELRGLDALLVDGYAMVRPTVFTSTDIIDLTGTGLAKGLLAAQALTIAGGTTAINRNVIGERLLGLPAEPRADSKTRSAP